MKKKNSQATVTEASAQAVLRRGIGPAATGGVADDEPDDQRAQDRHREQHGRRGEREGLGETCPGEVREHADHHLSLIHI